MEQYKSLYKRAAEQGVPVGMLLTALLLAVIYCDLQPWLAVAALLLLLSMPWVTWRMLRDYYGQEYGFTTFSSLWMMGILAYMGGSLIMALVGWAVLQFLRPDYVWLQVQRVIALYGADPTPEAQEVVAVMRGLIANHALPRPIELVMTFFWLTSFGGSLLSAVASVVVRAVPLPGGKNKKT